MSHSVLHTEKRRKRTKQKAYENRCGRGRHHRGRIIMLANYQAALKRASLFSQIALKLGFKGKSTDKVVRAS